MSYRNLSKVLLVSIAILACVLCSLSTSWSASRTLQVAYSAINAEYTSLWLSHEAGLFEKNGLNVDLVFTGRVRPVQLLISDTSPIVISTAAPVVDVNLAGTRDVIILSTISVKVGNFLFALPEIRKPQDLRNKIVGIGRVGAKFDLVLQLILHHWNMRPNQDVSLLSLDVHNIWPALEARRIQAGVVDIALRGILKEKGYNELADADQLGIKYAGNGVVTTRKYAKEHPDIVGRFLKAFVGGIHLFQTDKVLALKVMRKYLRITNEEKLVETYQVLRQHYVTVPYPDLEAIDSVIRAKRLLIGQTPELSAKELVDESFMRELDRSGFFRASNLR